MAGKVDRDPGETTFSVGGSKDTSTSKGRGGWVVMVWNVERIAWLALETLLAAPGHVLDHEEGSVRDEHHVECAMSNDGALATLNDSW